MYNTKGTQVYINCRFKNNTLNNNFIKIYSLNNNEIYKIFPYNDIIILNYTDWYIIKSVNIGYDVLIETFFPPHYDDMLSNEKGFYDSSLCDINPCFSSNNYYAYSNANCVPELGKPLFLF